MLYWSEKTRGRVIEPSFEFGGAPSYGQGAAGVGAAGSDEGDWSMGSSVWGRSVLGRLVVVLAGLAFLPVYGAKAAVDEQGIVDTYGTMAIAVYTDALKGAEHLQKAVADLLADPTAANLEVARTAWKMARVPYQQSEVFRFGNPVVDEWEGRVNAWPLDEGLIDYVDRSYGEESDENLLYAANVIANRQLTINGKSADLSVITPKLIRNVLHEAGGIEANVASGYHAVEFLLWGQDLNGTGPGAGMREASDYDPDRCTNGHCTRRRAYLKAAVDLLVMDLREMVDDWSGAGPARAFLVNGPVQKGLSDMVTGMGSLSYGELAGERMKLGLLLHDPEEEHDCFSDNTVYSFFEDARGIENVYFGRYQRTDGTVVTGPSFSDLVRQEAPALDAEMRANLRETRARMQALVDADKSGEAYDQMIAEGNAKGNQRVEAAIDALIAQTHTLERINAALKLDIFIQGSDSLEGADAVFQ